MQDCECNTGCYVQEGKEGLARVQDFLEQVALWSEPEKAAAEVEQEGAPDVVNVMTLHLSKGLEFAVVFIVGRQTTAVLQVPVISYCKGSCDIVAATVCLPTICAAKQLQECCHVCGAERLGPEAQTDKSAVLRMTQPDAPLAFIASGASILIDKRQEPS